VWIVEGVATRSNEVGVGFAVKVGALMSEVVEVQPGTVAGTDRSAPANQRA